MKYLFLSLLLCAAVSISTMAQNPIQWGVVVGGNLSAIEASSGLYVNSYASIQSFHAGIKAEFGLPAISDNIFLSGSLLFTGKGFKRTEFNAAGDITAESTYRPYYLLLPVHIGYKLAVADALKIVGSVGPHIEYGLFGNATTTGTTGVPEQKGSAFDDGAMARMDAGVGVKVGVEVNDIFQILFGYDHGMMNICDTEGIIWKNKNFTLTGVYLF